MFNNIINVNKQKIIKDTVDLVRTISVCEYNTKIKPFGKEVNMCLEKILNIAEKMGFKTKNIDNYAGYIEYGKGKEIIGVLTHIDVVPAGDNWIFDPFQGVIKDNRIYGRGTIDDKGPLIASLYALKTIKELKLELSKRVRIIIGLDEEIGNKSIKHYLENEEIPIMSFTPDGKFPVINREKGIMHIKIQKEIKCGSDSTIIEKFVGGEAINSVPEYCECTINGSKIGLNICDRIQNIKENINLDFEVVNNDNDKVTIKSFGIGAHASNPKLGENSIVQLIEVIQKLDYDDKQVDFLRYINKAVGKNLNGEGIGLNLKDQVSGELTMNLSKIKMNNNISEVDIDIRYPVTYSNDFVLKKLRKNIKEGYDIKVLKKVSPLYVKEDTYLVKKLTSIYNKETNSKSKPICIGGGTYARYLDNTVAFGPVFPEREDVSHKTNEFIYIDDLIKLTKIYAHSIYELSK